MGVAQKGGANAPHVQESRLSPKVAFVKSVNLEFARLDFELLSQKKWKELFEYCRQHPKIYQVQRTVGHMDFETEVVVKDLQELLGIIEEFKAKFSGTINNVDYFGYSTYHLLNYIPD